MMRIFILTFMLTGCTTSGTYDKDFGQSYAPPAGQSRSGNWVDGLMLVMTVVSTDKGVRGSKNHPQIFGTCKFKNKPCTKTFVLFKELKSKHETRVWVDDQGHFSMNVLRDQQFVLQAFNEEYGVQSKPLTVIKPSEVAITLEPAQLLREK